MYNPFSSQPEPPPAEGSVTPDNRDAFIAEMEPHLRALWDWCYDHGVPILFALQLEPTTVDKAGMHIIAAGGIDERASQTMQFMAVMLSRWLESRNQDGTGTRRSLSDLGIPEFGTHPPDNAPEE